MAERYHGARSGVSLTDWYAQQLVDDVVLYDITAQTATTLSSLIVKRQRPHPMSVTRRIGRRGRG